MNPRAVPDPESNRQVFVGMAGTAGAIHFSKPSTRLTTPRSAASPRLAAYFRVPAVIRALQSASPPDTPTTLRKKSTNPETTGPRDSKGHHPQTMSKVVPVISEDGPG